MAKLPKVVDDATSAVGLEVPGNRKQRHTKYLAWLDQAVQNRNKVDSGWLTYDLFKRGYHYAMYNTQTGEIVFQQDNRLIFRVTVNKIFSTLRAVRNYVTRGEPKWEVKPKPTETIGLDQAVEIAKRKNRVLEYFFDKLQIKRRLKEIINDSLTYSVGFWVVSWDEATQMPKVEGESPYNIYFADPFLPLEKQPYIFRVVRDLTASAKDNKDLKRTGRLKSDSKLAISPSLALLLQTVNGTNKDEPNDSAGTYFKIELYLKSNKPNSKGGFISRITLSDVDIHLEEDTEFKRYPIEMMQIEASQGHIYSESWVKHLIPLQRAMNALYSWLLEYHFYVTKGRWQMDKNAGAAMFLNENGLIIEHKQGSSVSQLAPQGAPASHMDQLAATTNMFEDIGGQHDASAGRVPTGAKSGKAIEALQVGDSNNLSDVVDAAEDVLEHTGEAILELISKHQDTSKPIQVPTDGGFDNISIIGAKGVAGTGMVPEGTTIIDGDNEVAVSIGSSLGESPAEIRDFALQLFRDKLIDARSALLMIKTGTMPAIEEIMERLINPEVSPDNIQAPDLETAQQENEAMAQGQPVPPTPNPSQEHDMVHYALLSAPNAPQEVRDLVTAHVGGGGELPMQEVGIPEGAPMQAPLA